MAEDKKEQHIDIELDATLANGNLFKFSNHQSFSFRVCGGFCEFDAWSPQSQCTISDYSHSRTRQALFKKVRRTKVSSQHGEIDTTTRQIFMNGPQYLDNYNVEV